MNKFTNKCSICNKFVESIESLHAHCIKKHGNAFVTCSVCLEPVQYGKRNTFGDLVNHANIYHGRQLKTMLPQSESSPIKLPKSYNQRTAKQFKCKVCDCHFLRRPNLERHYKAVHLRVRYLCPRCPCAFRRFDALKNHFEHHQQFVAPTPLTVAAPKFGKASNAARSSPTFGGFKYVEKEYAAIAYDIHTAELYTASATIEDGDSLMPPQYQEPMAWIPDTFAAPHSGFAGFDDIEQEKAKMRWQWTQKGIKINGLQPKWCVRLTHIPCDFNCEQSKIKFNLVERVRGRTLKLRSTALNDLDVFVDLT